jgi:Flp pilus assembly protein TadD
MAPWRAVARSPQPTAAGEPEDSTTGRSSRVVAPARAVGTAAAVAVVAFGAAELGRAALAVHYRAQASALVQRNPVAAIRRSNQSLQLESDQLATLYVKAAGFAALDDFPDARTVLQQALRSAHGDPVTWTLIGDIALRAGHRREAHSAYVNAAKLNPRDATIAASVRATSGRG